MLHVGSAEPSMTKMVNHGVSFGGGGVVPWTSSGKVAPLNISEVAEAPAGTASLYIQSIGIPWDTGLCRAQYSPIGNLTAEIGQCA